MFAWERKLGGRMCARRAAVKDASERGCSSDRRRGMVMMMQWWRRRRRRWWWE
jgi:hypothetical protein